MHVPSIYTYSSFFFPEVDVSETKANKRTQHDQESQVTLQRPMDNFDMDIDNFVSCIDPEQKEMTPADDSNNKYQFNPAIVKMHFCFYLNIPRNQMYIINNKNTHLGVKCTQ